MVARNTDSENSNEPRTDAEEDQHSVSTTGSDDVPWKAVGSFGIGLLGMGLAVGGYGAYVSLLVAQGVAPSTAGFGMTLFLLGQSVIVLPADWISRRIPTHHVAAIGYLVAGTGAIIGGVVDTGFVFTSRTLLGLGQGLAFIGGMKYVGLRTRGSVTAAAQGTMGAMFTLGLAAGLAATPLIIGATGPMIPAVVAAVLLAAGMGGAIRLVAVPSTGMPSLARYLRPLRSPIGITLGLGNVASFGFLMVASTWYTEVLTSVPVIPTTAALTGFALATVTGRLSGGWITRRVPRETLVQVVFVGLTALLGLASIGIWLDSPVLLVLTLVGTGFGFGLPFGPLFSLAFSSLAEDPGVTLVTMLVIGNVGALAYPWAVGRLFETTASYVTSFAAMAVSVGIVTIAWQVTVVRSHPG